jgi:hypothetical protein
MLRYQVGRVFDGKEVGEMFNFENNQVHCFCKFETVRNLYQQLMNEIYSTQQTLTPSPYLKNTKRHLDRIKTKVKDATRSRLDSSNNVVERVNRLSEHYAKNRDESGRPSI